MKHDSSIADRVDSKTNLFNLNPVADISGDRLWGLLVVFSALAVGGFLGLLTCPHTKVMFF